MDPGGGIFTLDGALATEASTLLPEFCTVPLPRTRVETPYRYLLHFVEPDEKAVDPLDVVVGQRFSSFRPAERRDHPLRLSLGVRIPSQQLLCSIFTHENIPMGPSPTLRMFHPGTREMPGPVDARWFDQIADLGNPRRIASPEQLCDSRAERILQGMGRMLFEKLGWKTDSYTHHVVDVAMPIWGVEYIVDFA